MLSPKLTINITEDEEKWLYDDDTEYELKNEKIPCAYTSGEISQEISLEVRQSTSNEDPTPEFESDLKDFEDDSDDDGIIVSIGNTDVQPTVTHDTPNIKINGGLLAAKNEKPQLVPQLSKFLVEDFTKPGNIDGTPVAEFNIDNVVEKPWRQPGADISDYFNYNFNENTWTAYCERQKRIKLNESGSSHLQSNTSHCAIPVINGHPNVPLGVIDVSKPPPMFNLEQFRPEHLNKPSQEKPSYTSPRPPISSSSSSSRSNSNTRSTKSVREEKINVRKNDSKERDMNKRRERSRERHNRRYERREKSRSRSRRRRSRSRSPRDRYYGNNRSRRGGYH